MLHALVLALAIWFALWSIALAPFYPFSALKLGIQILEEVGPVAALTLLRLGFLRQASLVYLGGAWVFATVVIALNGGVRSPDQAFYVALPILATWLLGYRAALWTARVLGSALVFAYIELAGVHFVDIVPGTPLGIWAGVLLQVILIAAVPVAQFLRDLQEALSESRQTQAELRDYKEHLEQLVQQRTAELVAAHDQALAANRAKSTFLAHMSHELRTPLNAILGFSEMVLRRANLSDQDRADLTTVGQSGEHLLELIDDVLDMAKVETGRISVESAPLGLHLLVTETIAMLRERAEAKNLQLLLEISSRTPEFIRSDAGKLRQVLTNLVGNAVKYTEAGRVIVRVDCRIEGDSTIGTVVLDVEDTGIGIAAEDQARIFDPFFQAAKARNTKGTGLGLSITRNFVQLLGGTIQVDSDPGRGSRFRVEVPVCTAQAVEVEAADSSHDPVLSLEPGQPEFRILVVEDQKENSVLLQRLLQEVGFQVRLAEDGAQAIDGFRAWHPHFIWMDIRLPVMSGLEAAARIRELEGGRDIKIIALTASAFASQRDEVLAAGFDGFLRKPYRRGEIFDCMARHLGVHYVYKSGPEKTDALVPVALHPAELAAIPEGVREELENAVISLNARRIMAAVSRVAEQDATLGDALARLAGKYRYTAILDALLGCKKSSVANRSA